ncbi:Saccharopine dehydrogenase [Lipomyces oligophaga]|uniref:Saccharopine dehydrogenase n=1 Tax=Lipomyces oligophaga TaxID=45792 RepID=UPI0034CD7222
MRALFSLSNSLGTVLRRSSNLGRQAIANSRQLNRKVLLLGSGFVAKPTVEILAARPDTQVTVACRTLEKAKELAGDSASTNAISLDVTDPAALDAAIKNCDLVISLIPYIYHATVAKAAIVNGKNTLTTSYISPAIQALDEDAKKAGVVVFNEIGLDPGIDHLYAVKAIDEIHQQGGKVTSFLSYCGGLPAPEDSDNPLGYKFSWSSRGVLLALRNTARFYLDGKTVEIPGPELMKSAKPYFVYPGYSFLAYGNRDSTGFRELYKIPEAQTVIRGTLRYQGFTDFVLVLVDIGMLDDSEKDYFKSAIPWKEAFAQHIGAKSSSETDLLAAIESKATFSSEEEKTRIIKGMRWLGLFSDKPITPKGNALDTLCATLEELMQYEPGERDFVILQHKFGITWPDGSTETRTSTLADYGDPKGYSSMARLVGTPCAVAAELILDGYFKQTGVVAPYSPEICDPLRNILKEKYNIYLKEKTIA